MSTVITQSQKEQSSRIANRKLRSLLSTTTLTAAGLLALSSSPALAVDVLETPTGGVVVGGAPNATIDDHLAPSGDLSVNQFADRVVIDWATFNIGTDAIVKFFQPGPSSLAVNRVTNAGADPSQILGTLFANGRVMILDRNGVFFDADSTIDVGGIVASTGDLMNQAGFLGGDNPILSNFGLGSVINETTISIDGAGLAAFVAPTVINNGIIRAKMGRVYLAGASGDATITVDLFGDGLFEIAATTLGGIFVTNHSVVHAEGGVIQMTTATAKGLVDGVINMNGVADASSVTVAGGKIVLNAGENGDVNVAGTVDAGSVDVSGESVRIKSSADVNADDVILRADFLDIQVGGSVSANKVSILRQSNGVISLASSAAAAAQQVVVDAEAGVTAAELNLVGALQTLADVETLPISLQDKALART